MKIAISELIIDFENLIPINQIQSLLNTVQEIVLSSDIFELENLPNSADEVGSAVYYLKQQGAI